MPENAERAFTDFTRMKTRYSTHANLTAWKRATLRFLNAYFMYIGRFAAGKFSVFHGNFFFTAIESDIHILFL
jgi:hypothetical protein